MININVLLLFLITSCLISCGGCMNKGSKQPEVIQKITLKVPVDVDKAFFGPIMRRLDVVGSFDYDVTVKLSPQGCR